MEEGEITSKDEVARTLVEKVGKSQKTIPPRLARAAQRSDSYTSASVTRNSKPSGTGKIRKTKKTLIMSGFFRNVRGLNKSVKHFVIKKWIEEYQFGFSCLIETRVKEEKVQAMSSNIFNNWSVLTNYEYNSRGRIWVVWKSNVRFTIFFKSSQVITCSVKLEELDNEFFCSFIYASTFLITMTLLSS